MKNKNIASFPIGHTQIIHFTTGIKRTIRDVQAVWENEMTHIIDGEGTEWVVNKSNVICVEIIKEENVKENNR